MIDPRRALSIGSAWLAPVAVAVALGVGMTLGLGPGLLVLAGGALLGAVLLLWSSLERLTGESPLTLDEAIGLGAPSPEEERKRSVLRALKDLEYERSVGKISETDYAELSSRYRGEAKALLRTLDTELGGLRRAAEERLLARLRDEGLGPEPEGARAAEEPAVLTSEPMACHACGAANDADASFCKRCGARLSDGAAS